MSIAFLSFFFSSRRRHTRCYRDWSSDVCSSDLGGPSLILAQAAGDSLLDCRRPVWADAIAPRGRGTGDCYVAAYETPAVFLYAEKVVSAADAPQDWEIGRASCRERVEGWEEAGE